MNGRSLLLLFRLLFKLVFWLYYTFVGFICREGAFPFSSCLLLSSRFGFIWHFWIYLKGRSLLLLFRLMIWVYYTFSGFIWKEGACSWFCFIIYLLALFGKEGACPFSSALFWSSRFGFIWYFWLCLKGRSPSNKGVVGEGGLFFHFFNLPHGYFSMKILRRVFFRI